MYEKEIDNLYKNIGERIVAERRKRGISQEKLAGDSGIDRSHMGYIEQGRRRPTLSTLYRVTRALGIKVSDLLRNI